MKIEETVYLHGTKETWIVNVATDENIQSLAFDGEAMARQVAHALRLAYKCGFEERENR